MSARLSGLFLAVIFLVVIQAAEAQQPAKVYKIGLLLGGNLLPSSSDIEAFREGLRTFGYVEGQNVGMEYRVQKRRGEAGTHAAELVRLNVDVIVATSTGPALAAKKATKTIPIVFAGVSDPVGAGLVASFARPQGNVTGLNQRAPELAGKRLEILKEVVPKLSRIAVLWHLDGPGQRPQMDALEFAAKALRVKLQPLDMREPKQLESLFDDAARASADGLVVLVSPRFRSRQTEIVALAINRRLPSVYDSIDWVEANGLMSYGPNSADLWRRTSYYVYKILRGVKPGDLPVEGPAKFDLAINLKSAKQIGLMIPPHVLARADRVIR
jgi:putative ABC transport system substrate-binding protein